MGIAIALTVSFVGLLLAVQQGISIFYPLLGALSLMTAVYWRRGVGLRPLLGQMKQGVQQSSGVLSILMLIGVVVASWLVSGTVPALVFYGLKLIHPQWFLVSAFVLTGMVSALLGTSFGSAGTIGLALMIMARGADVHEYWAAGAVISGAYVGDRCSPMSSSAHLVATITGTDIYRNLRNMMITGWGALALSVLIYGAASLRHPLSIVENPLLDSIPTTFVIHPITLLPAGLLVVLTLCRLPVRRTLIISLGSAIVLALTLQSQSLVTVITTLVLGLRLPETDPLSDIFRGGGFWAMAQVCGVVLVSTALAGLLSGQGTFNSVGHGLARWSGKRGLFGSTVFAGGLTSAFGCTQTIAILLTQQITQPLYVASRTSQEQLAVDIENSAVVIAPLIPWNIAGLVPATVILTDSGFIPYAIYLYLLPICNWLFRAVLPNSPIRLERTERSISM
ncbi:Na+/H+ antiporter NhaC family protein [Oscillatoria sp. CS-180]|uniref:Na+/H+ antiporter NhaC family protein n=1 Tax=Oscillatoria sp. CS-180 TaxID=3021720 RepID=UPI002330B2A4|nr:Na+/H+ antiporter NhaC family protein [Oscillatoria sp. CS-180]MDB9524758.1 Na+/H+ antiporter NhaC family protein [Oscillatoria sp. CS-180]